MKKFLAILMTMLLLCGCMAFAESDFDADVDMVYVTSFEEAAALYAGEVPAFTAPAGFYLHEILVDDFGLTAYYSTIDPNAAGQDDADAEICTFEFSMYDYGREEGVTHYSMNGGVLSEAAASMVALYEEDGMIYSADIHTVKGDIYFFFDGLDRAQVESALAGLAI